MSRKEHSLPYGGFDRLIKSEALQAQMDETAKEVQQRVGQDHLSSEPQQKVPDPAPGETPLKNTPDSAPSAPTTTTKDSALTTLATELTQETTPTPTETTTPTPNESTSAPEPTGIIGFYKRFKTPIHIATVLATLTAGQLLSRGPKAGSAEKDAKGGQKQEQAIKGGQATSQQAIEQARRELAGSPEQRLVSEYTVADLRIVGDRLVGLIQLPSDNLWRVVVSETDQTGNVALKEKGKLSFRGVAVAASETNPNLLVAVGGNRLTNEANVAVSKDGGASWKTINYAGGAYDVQISPDNKYVFISGTSQDPEKGVLMLRLDSESYSLVNLSIDGDARSNGISSLTSMAANGSPETYTSYGTVPLRTGYYAFTFSPTGIQSQRYNIDEGYPYGELVQFQKSPGQEVVWLFNVDTETPSVPNGRHGTVYENINNTRINEIRPNVDLYTLQGSILVLHGTADTILQKGYLATIVNENNIGRPFVEIIDMNDPTNLSKRQLIPNDGAWPAVSNTTYSLHYKEQAGEKYLYAAIDSGIFRRRITNGINSTDVWEKYQVSLLVLLRQYLPGVSVSR